MNISHFKNKNIHLVECENWQDVYGYEKSEMKEDIINYIEQLQQENKKYKDVIDRIEKYIEKETRIYGLSMSIELGTHFDNILGILKEVE